MSGIPHITFSEEWVAKTSSKERFRRGIEPQHAVAGGRSSASDREPTAWPVIFRQAVDGNLVVFKTGDRKYRRQFFYKPYPQFGTGVREYDDLTERTVALRQAQADQTAEERGGLRTQRR